MLYDCLQGHYGVSCWNRQQIQMQIQMHHDLHMPPTHSLIQQSSEYMTIHFCLGPDRAHVTSDEGCRSATDTHVQLEEQKVARV